MTVDEVIAQIKKSASAKNKEGQRHYGIDGSNSYGLSMPRTKEIAKMAGKDHALALALWKTGIHEAQHIATMIADKNLVTVKLMEQWLKDFDSWDIVDGCCSTLFDKTPIAYEKAKEWTQRKGEFQKRAGFTMMATLAVHDKKAKDEMFEQFFPYLLSESADERNYVKKAVNWAIRQIGKRNIRLCKKAIALTETIRAKGDSCSRWVAADALRELKKYQVAGKIRDIGKK